MSGYRCIVCGGAITVDEQPIDDAAMFGVTVTLQHVEQMDAACRLLYGPTRGRRGR